MKTAVLISGQLRTFRKCYLTQRWQIFRHYEPDIHFFVSCCADDQAAHAGLILSPDYESVHIENYQDPPDLMDVPAYKGEHAPYANATSHCKLMLQHWGNKKVWDFFASSAATESFDVVIRIRPDLWIHRFEQPRMFESWPNIVKAPWWGKFGGINDRLAIMGKGAAAAYFTLYDAIPTLLKNGAPFHPETLLTEWLRISGAIVESNLGTEFSTDRMDGSRRWWTSEVLPCDRPPNE